MKVVVFGTTGQVGLELRQRQSPDIQLTAFGRDAADFRNPETCADLVNDTDADVIINAAAYTVVDDAEENEALATLINGTTPAAIAKAAVQRGIPFLHISTDYVFDGQGEAFWQPANATAPINAYGRSKLAGEEGIAAAGGPHAILRTSWVFSAHGRNFVKTMLNLARNREEITVVADQFGGPTYAGDIAEALLQMALAFSRGNGETGIYHFCGSPVTTWAGFAREIFTIAGLGTVVRDVPSSEFVTAAKRPANSRLDCTEITRVFGISPPHWKIGLAHVIEKLNNAEGGR